MVTPKRRCKTDTAYRDWGKARAVVPTAFCQCQEAARAGAIHFSKGKMGQKEGIWRKHDFSQLTLPHPALETVETPAGMKKE